MGLGKLFVPSSVRSSNSWCGGSQWHQAPSPQPSHSWNEHKSHYDVSFILPNLLSASRTLEFLNPVPLTLSSSSFCQLTLCWRIPGLHILACPPYCCIIDLGTPPKIHLCTLRMREECHLLSSQLLTWMPTPGSLGTLLKAGLGREAGKGWSEAMSVPWDTVRRVGRKLLPMEDPTWPGGVCKMSWSPCRAPSREIKPVGVTR